MSPSFIKIGNFEIKWYSILLLIAFTIGYFLIIRQRKKVNLSKLELTDLLFYLTIASLLGARIYYVLFNLDYYLKYPIDILKIWEGGLAIHGGIIFGAIYLLIYCYRKRINILNFTDIIVLPLSLGQAIGRWGNFFNQEAYGPLTNYSTLKSLHIPQFIIDGMYIDNHYYHPTFFYESIWCLIIFITLIILMKMKVKKKGLFTSIYLIMYGIERFFVEQMRQDSLIFFNLKIAQIVSIIMIIIGVILLIKSRRMYDK